MAVVGHLDFSSGLRGLEAPCPSTPVRGPSGVRRLPRLNVHTRDLEATTKLWTALLGVAPHTETPYYVGWNVGGQEIGLDPHGHDKGMTGTVGTWHVPDVTAKVAATRTATTSARSRSDQAESNPASTSTPARQLFQCQLR